MIYELYENIVLNAIESTKIKINKCRKNFMLEIFMLYLSIPMRINFRWCCKKYADDFILNAKTRSRKAAKEKTSLRICAKTNYCFYISIKK